MLIQNGNMASHLERIIIITISALQFMRRSKSYQINMIWYEYYSKSIGKYVNGFYFVFFSPTTFLLSGKNIGDSFGAWYSSWIIRWFKLLSFSIATMFGPSSFAAYYYHRTLAPFSGFTSHSVFLIRSHRIGLDYIASENIIIFLLVIRLHADMKWINNWEFSHSFFYISIHIYVSRDFQSISSHTYRST